jgi:hypothetical protein
MIADISSQLAENGLILRGGFAFDDDEALPAGIAGTRAILLVGHGGPSIWLHFQAWLAGQPPGIANPLDTWSRETIGAVASRFNARAVSPSDRPWLPFQQWAIRAERLKPSPLGILMHPEFGLWHAYRGALLFADKDAAEAIAFMARDLHLPIHLCDGCDGKPCMNACPVDAYSAAGFAYESCLAHVRSPRGGDCREGGCLDRNACPYDAFRYSAEQQAFHMRAFAQ